MDSDTRGLLYQLLGRWIMVSAFTVVLPMMVFGTARAEGTLPKILFGLPGWRACFPVRPTTGFNTGALAVIGVRFHYETGHADDTSPG
jgi:hypothetical protein